MADFTTTMSSIGVFDAHLIKAYQQIYLVEQANLAKGLDSLVTKRFSDKAQTISFPKYSQLSLATTALTDKEDPASTVMADAEITLTALEYGNTSQITVYADAMSGGLPQLGTVAVHAKNMVETQEKLLILAGEAGSNELTVNATNEASTASTEVLTAAWVKRARNKLARVGAQKPWSCIIHPDVLHDLMIETGTNAWNEQARYSENVRVFSVGIPEFAGFTFYESALVTVNTDAGSSSVDTYHTQFFGFNAFGKFVNIEPQMRLTGPFDKLGRFYNIGWYGLFKYGLIDTDYHWIVTSASSIGSNA